MCSNRLYAGSSKIACTIPPWPVKSFSTTTAITNASHRPMMVACLHIKILADMRQKQPTTNSSTQCSIQSSNSSSPTTPLMAVDLNRVDHRTQRLPSPEMAPFPNAVTKRNYFVKDDAYSQARFSSCLIYVLVRRSHSLSSVIDRTFVFDSK